MYQQITIKTLRKQGKTNAEIARTLGCHRNTVHKILKRGALTEKQTRIKPSMFDRCKEQIKAWMEQKITKLRINEKLQEEYGIYSTYVNLCIYVNKHFPAPKEAFGVQLTAPGEDAEVDFGYLGMLPGKEGRPTKTWGLAVVLSYSRAAYYAICYDQKLDTLIQELTRAFTYFGGVPKRLKVDNMKTAVLRNQRHELEFNQDFLEFANHYTMIVVPCTPYSPEQKGKVEAGVKYLQNNFVNGRTFISNQDIAGKLSAWMRTYANQRVHGTTRKVPWKELITTERSALQPLPAEAFALFQRDIRKVQPNCHINFKNVYYSVPSQHVGREVTVRWNEHLIRVVHQGEELALHVRSPHEGTYVTVRAHLPEHKVYSETERQAKVEEQMRAIGEHAHEYFHLLLQRKPGYWMQTTRGVLGLCKEYGKEAVNLSLQRATHYQAVDVPTIRNILEKKLYALPLEPALPKVADEQPMLGRELGYYTVVYDANSLPVTA